MNKYPKPIISVLPLLVLIAMIIFVLINFPDDALSGASQVALMTATAVCVALGMIIYKMKWQTFEVVIKQTIGDAGVSILILLMIGMMSSTWMVSGIVPTFIYYGVQIMSPLLFLPCACIISAIISVMTGTSWTTIATIGIALLGIGDALGIPAPYTAGAIISGAYFGDKMSPMSDTTVLASSMAGCDLFVHIRYMMYTTVPSIIIALILYTIMGFWYSGETVDTLQYTEGLAHTFNISLWTLVVPLFTGYLIFRKVPSLITLLLSSIAACICAAVLQPQVLAEIAGKEMGLEATGQAIMTTCYTSTNIETGNEALNSLVATRGMSGMMNTIWLILCAMCFGSCMVASNMLKSITQVLLKAIHNTFSLVFSTVASGILFNIIMGDQFLSIIMNASIFKEEYAERGYEPQLLSRCTEDSSTVTSVLVPWTACGMTQATVLGIPTIVYLPFCFFNLITPIMSCLVAALGFVKKPVVKTVVPLLLLCLLTACNGNKERFVPKTLNDLRGHTVAVNSGTTQEKIARSVTEKENVLCMPGGLDALVSLDAGQCDAALIERSNMFTDDFLRMGVEEAFTDSSTQEPLACALRKDDVALLMEYTNFFDSIAACGRLDEIKSRWLNPQLTDNLKKVAIRAKDVPTQGKRVLHIGSDYSYPPYTITINNEKTGYEIELWQRFCMAKGYGLVCDVYTFDGLLPALQSKKIDIIAAGMSVTPDREKVVNFTPADDYSVTTVLIRKEGNQGNYGFIHRIREGFDRSLVQQNRWEMILDGFWVTLWIFFGSLILGIVLGAFLSWMQMNVHRSVRIIANAYISLMRNIPILVLLLVMYYIILAGTGLTAIWVAIIASAMNFAAYIAVMFTTGIRAVDNGQREAGLALGLTSMQTFIYIIMPQAARHIIPVFQGEAISLLKGTSIVGYISIVDLTKASDLIRNASFEAFFPLIFTAVIYFCLCWILGKSLDLLLKKVDK